MFRIKNVRGSTVGKANNFSPQIPQQQPHKFEQKKQVINNFKRNEEKVILPNIENKSKKRPPSRVNYGASRKNVLPTKINKQKQKELNEVSHKILQEKIQIKQEEKKQEFVTEKQIMVKEEEFEEKKQINIKQQSENEEELLEAKRKLEEIELEAIKRKEQLERQQEQRERKERQQKSRRRKKRQEQRIKKEQEEKKQKQREEKAQRDIQRIMKRRQQRQKERKRKKQLQQKRKEQFEKLEERLSNQPNEGLGGMMHLNDPLAHFELSELIMDAQINKILKTSFAHFPNGQAIQLQKEELSRMNDSYTIIRDDPTNNLKEGLKNYRIQIFNRIGNLIMEAQRSGYSNQNFSLLQTDSRNPYPLRDATVMRGLPKDKMKLFAKQKVQNRQNQDCAICLQGIGKGVKMSELQCGHGFHQNCLEEWLQGNANCPSCRHNVKFSKNIY